MKISKSVLGLAMAGLLSTIGFASSPAAARMSIHPMLDIQGTYQLQNCAGDLRNVDKALVRFRNSNLEIFAFDLDSREELSFPMSKGQKPGQADGTESWDYRLNISDMVFSKRFERRGSDTWPDLGYETITAFSVTNYGVKLQQVTKTLWGHSSNQSWTCEMHRMATSWTASPIEAAQQSAVLQGSAIEGLATMPLSAGMDLDQAQVDQKLLSVSTAQLSREQLKEILLTEVLPYGPTLEDIRVQAVGPRSSPANTARRALSTALGIANDRIKEDASVRPDYKSLFDLVDAMSALLATKPAGLKFYFIQWSESDADGEGLLIIDETRQQIYYVGSSYFS